MLSKTESYEATSVVRMRILYFLEDRAQEGFIKALVERIAREESIATDTLFHDIRSGRGGSTIINEFRNFLRDSAMTGATDIDFLIVAIDGNCKRPSRRVRQLEKLIRPDHPFKSRVVYAVPDPHIERWYIMDQRAFKEGVGLDKAPDLPSYKCRKDYYKRLVIQALKESDVSSLVGGAEYAERIVDKIVDLESLGTLDAGFQTFVEDLRGTFRSIMEGLV